MTTTESEQAMKAEYAAVKLKNTKRRKRRVWLLIATIPLLLATLILCTKIFTMYSSAHFAITSYLSGDAAGTVRNANLQQVLNWFEPVKAPFNIGTGHASGGELTEARARLEEALPLVDGLTVCPVTLNLTLVIEAQGDTETEADRIANGQALYQQALDLLRSTPRECQTDLASMQSSDVNRNMGEVILTTDARIKEKLIPPPPPEDPSSPPETPPDEQTPPEEDDTPSEGQLEELKDRLEQGERDRNNDSNSGFSGTDKPW